jgi:hypothetical protein
MHAPHKMFKTSQKEFLFCNKLFPIGKENVKEVIILVAKVYKSAFWRDLEKLVNKRNKTYKFLF